jgi:hypothetical protein
MYTPPQKLLEMPYVTPMSCRPPAAGSWQGTDGRGMET